MEVDNKFLDLIFNELFHDGNFRVVTMFGCKVNMESMQEDAFLVRSVGLFISYRNSNWDNMSLVLEP